MSTTLTQVMSKPCLYWIPETLLLGLGETIFDLNFSVSTMPTAIRRLGEKAMPGLDRLNTHRRFIADIYEKSFHAGSVIPIPVDSTPVYTRFPLMAGPGNMSDELRKLGVRRMYPKAISNEEKIREYLSGQQEPTPGASCIEQGLLTLPTHMGITEDMADEIATLLKKVCQ